MNNINKDACLIWITIIVISLAIGLTNTMVNGKEAKKEVLSYATTSLKSSSADLIQYEKVILEPNEDNLMHISMHNQLDKTLYYSIWYEVINVDNQTSNVIVTKHDSSENDTQGVLNIAETGDIVLDLHNEGDSEVSLNIGIIYSLKDDYQLTPTRNIVKTVSKGQSIAKLSN